MRNGLKKEIFVIADLKTQTLWFKILKIVLMLSTFIIFTILVDILVAVMWFILLFIFGNTIHFTYRWKTNAWTKSWGRWKILSDENRRPQMLFNVYFIGSWVITVILTLILILFR
ncbi:MAG: hypothetical protein ACXAC8_16205 [Candidatus Hodarchaeales archaeon]